MHNWVGLLATAEVAHTSKSATKRSRHYSTRGSQWHEAMAAGLSLGAGVRTWCRRGRASRLPIPSLIAQSVIATHPSYLKQPLDTSDPKASSAPHSLATRMHMCGGAAPRGPPGTLPAAASASPRSRRCPARDSNHLHILPYGPICRGRLRCAVVPHRILCVRIRARLPSGIGSSYGKSRLTGFTTLCQSSSRKPQACRSKRWTSRSWARSTRTQ